MIPARPAIIIIQGSYVKESYMKKLRKDTRLVPDNFIPPSQYRDKFIYIVSLLFYKHISNKRHKDQYINLKMEYLRKILGRRYTKTILDTLESMDIIICDGIYTTGVKSLGYKLTEQYINEPLKTVRLSKKFNDRVLLVMQTIRNKRILAMNTINREHELAHALNIEYLDNCLYNVSMLTDVHDYIETLDVPLDTLKQYYQSISMFDNGAVMFGEDAHGRVHTSITNLKSEFRKYLRYEGHELYEVDISNAQPLMLNILLNKYNTIDTTKETTSTPPLPLTLYDGTLTVTESTDIFRKQTENGTFYDYLYANHYNVFFDYSLKTHFNLSRSDVKLAFFKIVLFSRKQHYPEFKERFANVFPEIANMITYYKRDDHTRIALELQKIESTFIIDEVVPELRKRGIYCLTIHDAILTDEPHLVQDIMIEKFTEIYNLGITVKIKE